MSKKTLILAAVLVLAALGGWLLFRGQRNVQNVPKQPPVASEQPVEPPKTVENPVEPPEFQTTVDPNVDHWQTKETEFFTIKFPKEWYWLELPAKNLSGIHVITNNQRFHLSENLEIGLFAEIGDQTPIKIHNNAEFVMAERGVPTTNAGTPEDSLKSVFSLAKSNYPDVKCGRFTEQGVLPIQAWCTAVYPDHQMQQTFYSIDKVWSLEKSAWTTDTTIVKRDDLKKVAESFMLKGY